MYTDQMLLEKPSQTGELPVDSTDEDVYVFPTSFAQQRLWFTQQLDPGSAAYNVPLAVQIEGPLRVDALQRTIRAIVERHEILRTTFTVMDEETVQVIHPDRSVNVTEVGLHDIPEHERMAYAKQLAVEEAQRPFDLEQGPLLRVRLLRLEPNEHVLIITMHHIICDGWSMGIFINELTQLYGAYAHGQTPYLPDLPIQYADFAEWQREYLQGEQLEELLSYWMQQLGHELPVLRLPTARQDSSGQSEQGTQSVHLLPAQLSDALKEFPQAGQTTLYMTLLAAFKLLLHHESQQDDIVIGTDDANRNRREIEGLIGIFVNQLVLRSVLSGAPIFEEFVRQVRQTAIDAFDHQDLPFDELVKKINPERTSSNSPLFQAKFVFQNTPSTEPEISGLTLTPLSIMKETARFDLLWTMREMPDGLSIIAEYRTDLYSTAYVERLFNRFELLLQSIVEQPSARLSELVKPLIEADQAQKRMQQQAYEKAKQKSRRRARPKAMSIGAE